jgi:1-acyl-sn-glycerol-3-phosphate acyltransferase
MALDRGLGPHLPPSGHDAGSTRETPTVGRRLRSHLRAQLNRVLVVCTLVAVLPLVAIAERTRRGCGRVVARRAVQRLGSACGVRFETLGHDRLDPSGSYVFVANHSSLIDIPAVLTAFPEIQFLAASGLFRIPLLRSAMRALRTVPIDRHDRQEAHRQLDELAAGGGHLRILVFAEGGIAPVGQHLPFKNGAFVLAIQTGATVVPVAIHHSNEVLPPGARLSVRPGTVVVEILEAIQTDAMTGDDRHQLRDRTRLAVVAALELEAGDPTIATAAAA